MGVDSRLGRVGVVIVTYNSADVVAAAVGALDLRRFRGVVVVDNASSDDTVAVVRSACGSAVDVLAQPRNLGFGAGCNIGVAALAQVDFVLVLNPDAILGPANLAILVDYLDQHPRAGLVAPRMYRVGVPLTSAGHPATVRSELRTILPGRLRRLVRDRRLPPSYDRTGPVGYVEGACMLMRRSFLDAVGGFDERFFLFYEELDLAHELRRRGMTVELVAEASAEHVGRASRQSVAFEARPALLESASLYLEKWHGRSRADVYRWLAKTSITVQRYTGRMEAREAQALLAALRRPRRKQGAR